MFFKELYLLSNILVYIFAQINKQSYEEKAIHV
jgi:hypothetical protein